MSGEAEERRKGKKQGRKKGQEFPDVAMEAFIRYLALEKWREIQDLREALVGDELKEALQEAGRFQARGKYQGIWQKHWHRSVVDQLFLQEGGVLFGAIEQAVKASVEEEEAERRRRGDPSLFEERDFRAFMVFSLERLFSEAEAEVGDPEGRSP